MRYKRVVSASRGAVARRPTPQGEGARRAPGAPPTLLCTAVSAESRFGANAESPRDEPSRPVARTHMIRRAFRPVETLSNAAERSARAPPGQLRGRWPRIGGGRAGGDGGTGRDAPAADAWRWRLPSTPPGGEAGAGGFLASRRWVGRTSMLRWPEDAPWFCKRCGGCAVDACDRASTCVCFPLAIFKEGLRLTWHPTRHCSECAPTECRLRSSSDAVRLARERCAAARPRRHGVELSDRPGTR